MYRLEREEFVRPPYIALWSLLGFQAGFINAFGFIACGRYVSHVTGFGTQIGVALGQKEPWFALELLGFPLSFIFGSFCSGLFTVARIERGLRPRFNLITLFFPVALLLLIVFGQKGLFCALEGTVVHDHDLALLFILSFICGIQNGTFAVLTKGQIRTTHLTGISTDIGTDLARIWFGKLNQSERVLTRWTNYCRYLTFSFFAVGSISSVLLSQHYGYLALSAVFCTSMFAFFMVRWIEERMDKKFKTTTS